MHLGAWQYEKMALNELGKGFQPIGKAKAGLETDVVSETRRLKI